MIAAQRHSGWTHTPSAVPVRGAARGTEWTQAAAATAAADNALGKGAAPTPKPKPLRMHRCFVSAATATPTSAGTITPTKPARGTRGLAEGATVARHEIEAARAGAREAVVDAAAAQQRHVGSHITSSIIIGRIGGMSRCQLVLRTAMRTWRRTIARTTPRTHPRQRTRRLPPPTSPDRSR